MKGIFLMLTFSFSLIAFSSAEVEAILIKDLKAISKIEKRNDNQAFKLLKDSASSLEKKWNKSLSVEMVRVYKLVLNKNPNFFITELIYPALESKPKEMKALLEKELKSSELELHKENIKLIKRRIKKGNG